MQDSWALWVAVALALAMGLAVAFVVGSYLHAVVLTRGRFGWPGLRYFATETLWVWITQSLLPVGWLRRDVPAAPRRLPPAPAGDAAASGATPRPVVFVHGFTQNRMNFVWLSRVLRRRGHGPFFGFDYPSFGRIEASAKELEAFVEQVIAVTGAAQVDLVCHSLGGLVARTYVDLLGGHGRVRSVVTLGTPHRGLAHASGRFGASVADMQPRTGFIARLDGAPLPPRVSYLSIYSVHDNIVFPSDVSSLGSRGRDVVVHRHGHFGILFSYEVADHVHRALAVEHA